MRIVVAGARGYIGSRIVKQLLTDDMPVLPLSSSSSSGFDVLDLSHVEKFDCSILQANDVVMLTAAISAPDACATDARKAREVNVTGAREFISLCLDRGAKVLFFSSDTVYGAQEEPFDESGNCMPAGAYAEMKHEVEDTFLGESFFKTIRLSYVFSNQDKFTKYLMDCYEKKITAEVFHPFYRPIVHRDDVVHGAIALAIDWEKFPQRIINFGGPELLSRMDFAHLLKEYFLNDLQIKQIEPESQFFENRPRVINMKSPLLALLLDRPVSSLRDAILKEFLRA